MPNKTAPADTMICRVWAVLLAVVLIVVSACGDHTTTTAPTPVMPVFGGDAWMTETPVVSGLGPGGAGDLFVQLFQYSGAPTVAIVDVGTATDTLVGTWSVGNVSTLHGTNVTGIQQGANVTLAGSSASFSWSFSGTVGEVFSANGSGTRIITGTIITSTTPQPTAEIFYLFSQP